MHPDDPQPGQSVDITEHAADSSKDVQLPPDQTKAVAVEYDRAVDDAPRVTASGKGAIAEQILAVAFAQGIRVRKDADLVEVLSKVELDSPIPLEAFATVAEILAYVYNANACLKQNKWSQKAANPLDDL